MSTNLINNLRNKLEKGLRTTKYEINISNPAAGDMTDSTVLCKATSFPAKTIGQVEVWTQGHKAMLQGDTEFEHTWDVTFYETESHSLRQAFIDWMDAIDNAVENTHENFTDGSASVMQLSSTGNAKTAGYEFTNIWPQSVSSIELTDESVNTFGEFTVTFSFDYWVKDTSVSSTTSS